MEPPPDPHTNNSGEPSRDPPETANNDMNVDQNFDICNGDIPAVSDLDFSSGRKTGSHSHGDSHGPVSGSGHSGVDGDAAAPAAVPSLPPSSSLDFSSGRGDHSSGKEERHLSSLEFSSGPGSGETDKGEALATTAIEREEGKQQELVDGVNIAAIQGAEMPRHHQQVLHFSRESDRYYFMPRDEADKGTAMHGTPISMNVDNGAPAPPVSSVGSFGMMEHMRSLKRVRDPPTSPPANIAQTPRPRSRSAFTPSFTATPFFAGLYPSYTKAVSDTGADIDTLSGATTPPRPVSKRGKEGDLASEISYDPNMSYPSPLDNLATAAAIAPLVQHFAAEEPRLPPQETHVPTSAEIEEGTAAALGMSAEVGLYPVTPMSLPMPQEPLPSYSEIMGQNDEQMTAPEEQLPSISDAGAPSLLTLWREARASSECRSDESGGSDDDADSLTGTSGTPVSAQVDTSPPLPITPSMLYRGYQQRQHLMVGHEHGGAAAGAGVAGYQRVREEKDIDDDSTSTSPSPNPPMEQMNVDMPYANAPHGLQGWAQTLGTVRPPSRQALSAGKSGTGWGMPMYMAPGEDMSMPMPMQIDSKGEQAQLFEDEETRLARLAKEDAKKEALRLRKRVCSRRRRVKHANRVKVCEEEIAKLEELSANIRTQAWSTGLHNSLQWKNFNAPYATDPRCIPQEGSLVVASGVAEKLADTIQDAQQDLCEVSTLPLRLASLSWNETNQHTSTAPTINETNASGDNMNAGGERLPGLTQDPLAQTVLRVLGLTSEEAKLLHKEGRELFESNELLEGQVIMRVLRELKSLLTRGSRGVFDPTLAGGERVGNGDIGNILKRLHAITVEKGYGKLKSSFKSRADNTCEGILSWIRRETEQLKRETSPSF